MTNASIAVVFALISTLGYGVSFVLAQIALRRMRPSLGAGFSVPTATLLFGCVAPFAIDLSKADFVAGVLFAGIGWFSPPR